MLSQVSNCWPKTGKTFIFLWQFRLKYISYRCQYCFHVITLLPLNIGKKITRWMEKRVCLYPRRCQHKSPWGKHIKRNALAVSIHLLETVCVTSPVCTPLVCVTWFLWPCALGSSLVFVVLNVGGEFACFVAFYLWSIGNRTSSNSICNHTRDRQIGLPLRGRPILSSLVWFQTELGQVVRKPVNANPGLKVLTEVKIFSSIKILSTAYVLCRFRLLMLKTEGQKI